MHVFWGRNTRNSKSIHKTWIKNNSPKKKFDPQNTTVPQQLPKIPFFETAMSLVIFIEFLLTSSDCKVQSHFPSYHPCAGHRAVVKPAKASSIQPPRPDMMQGGSRGSCQSTRKIGCQPGRRLQVPLIKPDFQRLNITICSGITQFPGSGSMTSAET